MLPAGTFNLDRYHALASVAPLNPAPSHTPRRHTLTPANVKQVGDNYSLPSTRHDGKLRVSQPQPPPTSVFPFGMRSWILPGVQPTVTQLTDSLLASYAQVGGINHLDGKNLPSKRVISDITVNILRLLFPGFFDERVLHSSELKVETAGLLDAILNSLEDEVRKSFGYAPPPEASGADLRAYARQTTLSLLQSLPSVRELLQTDMQAAYNGDPAALSTEEVVLAYPCVEAIAVQRVAHQLYLRNVPLIPRIMTEWAHSRTGMDLHPGATIGSHFFVDHGTGTVIGETSVIGDHVKMYQGVGLVARSLSAGQQLRGLKRHPTIEDHVTIYAGATIIGGDTTIGEGSTIGASVFLTNSVPPHSLVVQEDANVKVLRKKDLKPSDTDFSI